jgi:hypothetical protein
MIDEKASTTDLGQRQREREAQPVQGQVRPQVQQMQKPAMAEAALLSGACPHCGSQLDDDADFCEVCHHYVRQNVCSFCGASLLPQDSFCPECGSPRGGIVCPTCHTLNDFAFCKQCGTPLTDDARQMMQEIQQMPDYKELVQLAKEYDELTLENPYESERDVKRDMALQQLRERVLKLLAQDEGVASPDIPQLKSKRMSKEELKAKKDEKLARLSELLDKMQIPPSPSPAHVRNYAMAQKPAGVRLAWVCNWKHAMHSSPCGCAKPQLGGKWIILGRGGKKEIKDDK